MKLSVVGTGYVGLVTAACLAEKGHHVICVDVDQDKLDKINRAIAPLHEAGLEALLKKNIPRRLRAIGDLREAVMDTEITFMTVGTPFNGHDIDLSFIREATTQIGQVLREKSAYHLVVVKSTVVPGTTDEVVIPLLGTTSGKKIGPGFGVGVNPEFLTEGQAVADCMSPDRLVIAANDEQGLQMLARVYAPFNGIPVLTTTNKTAEMIKYASNAMLATQISFANEIANLCSALGGIDVVDVMAGVHLSHYLSPATKDGTRIQAPISAFLEAGCGFGGSCLPKDVKALIAQGKKVGLPMSLLSAVIATNEHQPAQVLRLLKKHFPSLRDVRVSVLGLSFKPDTNDMRESPAIPIINELLANGSYLKAYDPVANDEARKLFPDHQLLLCATLEEAIANADAIILVTRWKEFKEIPELLKQLNPQALFIDGRRMLDKRSIIKYEGIGL